MKNPSTNPQRDFTRFDVCCKINWKVGESVLQSWGNMLDFSRECEKLLDRGEMSKKFYDELLRLFKIVSSKIFKERAFHEELVREFFQDFYPKLKKICEKIVSGEIQNPCGYFKQSMANFLLRKKEVSNRQVRTSSLYQQIGDSDEERIEKIDTIPAEANDPFIEVLADEAFELLLIECEKRRTDMKRYICFLIWKDFYKEESFAEPSWSEANKYKIRERTRKFLEDFMDRFSVEEKVMGRVLLRFLSEICQKLIMNE